MRKLWTVSIILLLAALVVIMVLERLIVAEYIRFLEKDLRIQQSYSRLKVGMSEDAIRSVIDIPPDRIALDVDENGTKVLVWSSKEELRPLHNMLGLTVGDGKSTRDLFLDFNREGILLRIYYGG